MALVLWDGEISLKQGDIQPPFPRGHFRLS